ncbi:LPXTG cell wall anchor domain-containing protein [Leucobacter aridicollis]|uniref:LPXTG cell wall anchor domain-containing protein n=1 Tax=Leucobacter aridicollis TaxID=283878 RepID=UPI0021020940|nr:LPXTG cell wall anchor domain-containing protein [Leucobacter aridicollis]UTX53307.1 LPXTG cell wall anchor domain-containing protein [Leucobacter aridicollis]
MDTNLSSRKRGRAPNLARNLAKKVGAVALAALLVGGPASLANANSGGGGGVGGGGIVNGNFMLYNFQYDELHQNAPMQGSMGASTEWFINSFANLASNGGNVSQGEGAKTKIREACSIALNRAESRGGNQGKSRVVGIMWVGTPTSPWADKASASASFFQDRWNEEVAGKGFPGIYTKAGSFMQQYWPEGLAGGGATPSAVCIALNQNEPPQEYNLSITTDKNVSFTAAGGTQAVSDTIHASAGSSDIRENVDAQVVMHWDGVEGNARSVTKNTTIKNHGDTKSPNFVPADFGWSTWPQSTHWFDVIVPKQGMMSAGVNTPDRDPRETWKLTPVAPEKELWTADMSRKLTDQDVLASGMMHNAVITAYPNGYASSMTITDLVETSDVYVGSTTKDDSNAVHVLDPDGKKVSGASVKLDRAGGKVTVSASVKSIPNKFQNLPYTLVVPTYVMPTKADYTIKDRSSVCYTATDKDCIDGPTEQTRKVTPTPDKVWVLDENGALTTQDPDWTNKEGADEKVFLQGDAVSAVVNGKVKGKLPSNLDNYQIIDDWTKAAKYVDFSDAKKANVFYETAPGSKKYTKVTDQFTVKVDGTRTIATAKPAFLSQTKDQSADRAVKLVISGEFRTDYDTDGKTVVLHNNGSEIWNNEEIPTNEPPVYTWTPDPNKQVLGNTSESGDHGHEDIHGMSVWPGQKLEYSLGIDLRIPGNTARGVKSLAVKDVFDPMFTPDKDSVEFWDSRDPKGPKPLPRSAYKLSWDDKEHSWTATFTDEWLAKNLGPNSEWLTQGWLTARFTGTVKKEALPGSTVKNQGFEILNGVSTATEIPEVKIPNPKPDKEDLNTNLVDIDGKTVLLGDTIVYRILLDAMPASSELAYNVHKFGMVDDYDEEYLEVNAEDIRITEKATGADVTGKFNIQVKDGVAYVFAKQVDSVGPNGDEIKGDPQPTDLKAYNEAEIDPSVTPIIDQNIMGKHYWITMPAKVIKTTDGYVIENQAVQNVENSHQQTKIVSNPLKEINPKKDVVIEAGTDESIDGTALKLDSQFNYRLQSSKLPAKRAYEASQWSILDTFDRVHDQYTGMWAVYADTDLYDGDELIAKAGDLLQDSDGGGVSDTLFAASFDEASYTFEISAQEDFFRLVNSRDDLEHQWSAYTKMIRIAPADKVVNEHTETYNEVERKSNEVVTSTPEHPAVELVKYTFSEGVKDGDRDKPAEALPLSKKDLKDGVKVGFRITNTGDVPLVNVKLSDLTDKGKAGTVKDIECVLPEGDSLEDGLKNTFAVGESINCTGILQGMGLGDVHSDTATVTGESVYTGKKVTDSDPWNAKAPAKPLAVTGGGAVSLGVLAAALLGGGGLVGLLAVQRRRKAAGVPVLQEDGA